MPFVLNLYLKQFTLSLAIESYFIHHHDTSIWWVEMLCHLILICIALVMSGIKHLFIMLRSHLLFVCDPSVHILYSSMASVAFYLLVRELIYVPGKRSLSSDISCKHFPHFVSFILTLLVHFFLLHTFYFLCNWICQYFILWLLHFVPRKISPLRLFFKFYNFFYFYGFIFIFKSLIHMKRSLR